MIGEANQMTIRPPTEGAGLLQAWSGTPEEQEEETPVD